jgi:hypothetical protein
MTPFCLLSVAHAVAQPVNWHAVTIVIRKSMLYRARCSGALHQLAALVWTPRPSKNQTPQEHPWTQL